MSVSMNRAVPVLLLVALWIAIPFSVSSSGPREAEYFRCPSGQMAARLTGWSLNGKFPEGTARYNQTSKTVEVSVESVSIPDGTVLGVFIGDDRIGELSPLSNGSAKATIGRELAEDARVRVFHVERPILSATLECVETPVSTPTVTPITTPTPTAIPSPTPTTTPTSTPTPDTAPSVSPTVDPMPSQSPLPSPTPNG